MPRHLPQCSICNSPVQYSMTPDAQRHSRSESQCQYERTCLMICKQMCERRPTLPEVEGLGGGQVGVQAVLASWREGGVHDGRYADQHHILHHSSTTSVLD